jgi:hypothetical protein
MNVQWFARLAQRLSGEVGRRQTFTLVGGTLTAALLNRESVAAGCKKAGRASRTGQPSAASSSSCARDAPGACSPRNSVAAAGRPAGDGCGTGRKLACGHGCTRPCSTGWAMPPLLIGTGRVSIHSASGPKGGRADRAEPGRPWQARLQIPSGRRPQWHPLGRVPLGGQRSRRDPAPAQY